MTLVDKLNVGVVGACGRGGGLASSLQHTGTARAQAVCDINAEGLRAARERLGAAEAYTEYDKMLEKSELDAVTGERPNPIGIHEAMDMTLPGRASQQSIRERGRWVHVPDSRER